MRLVIGGVVLSLLSLSFNARADTLSPGSNDSGVVSNISKGVKELAVESMLVVGYDKIGDASALRAVALAGGTFRYFVANNVALSLNANFLYRKSGTDQFGQVDLGGLALISAGYYASLGGGLFIVPQLGVGGTYAGRTLGEDPKAVRSTIIGGNGDLGLALAFYPSHHFSVRAGPDALLTVGSVKENVSGTSTSLLSLDAGFKIGMSYVF
jgi:hypothetical protein